MIRIGILGYGNLARGAEAAIRQNPDTSLAAVFTRRDPAGLKIATPGVPVLRTSEVLEWSKKIDVLLLCGGSAADLPEQTPYYAQYFNVVDSFDTHAMIPAHFSAVDAAARAAGKIALISCGWDPGLFSVARLYGECILPEGKTYTFWGRGVSQGHSDAIRRISGVRDARQYTVPVPEALEQVRAGKTPDLTTRQKHTRECFVVAEPGADLARIEREIKEMPHYFSDYDTTVTVITQEELDRDHRGIPHGGSVIRGGRTGLQKENAHTAEYRLKLDSNPEFTGSVLIACARAADRLFREGANGCKTLFDIPPAYFSPLSGEELRKRFL